MLPRLQQFHNPFIKAHKCSSFSKHSKQRPFVVVISKLSIHNLEGMNKNGTCKQNKALAISYSEKE
jgi:hypothetical protein